MGSFSLSGTNRSPETLSLCSTEIDLVLNWAVESIVVGRLITWPSETLTQAIFA